ncbi:MAG: biotin/lipoyl-binding protein [Planctomycetes bacterium]|nr:biotin/lipoyl-binding protein [Planctomycetota bacterium]
MDPRTDGSDASRSRREETPFAGVVKSIACREGAKVAKGAVLIEIESEEA